MYQIQALQQHRLPVFGTDIFKSESWNDSLGSKDNGSSSIKRKMFLLSESMSLSLIINVSFAAIDDEINKENVNESGSDNSIHDEVEDD